MDTLKELAETLTIKISYDDCVFKIKIKQKTITREHNGCLQEICAYLYNTHYGTNEYFPTVLDIQSTKKWLTIDFCTPSVHEPLPVEGLVLGLWELKGEHLKETLTDNPECHIVSDDKTLFVTTESKQVFIKKDMLSPCTEDDTE